MFSFSYKILLFKIVFFGDTICYYLSLPSFLGFVCKRNILKLQALSEYQPEVGKCEKSIYAMRPIHRTLKPRRKTVIPIGCINPIIPAIIRIMATGSNSFLNFRRTMESSLLNEKPRVDSFSRNSCTHN